MNNYISLYLSELWAILNSMSFYLIIGFLFAGILHIAFTKDQITKYLGSNNILSVINASIIGVPLPLCSCGVIPTGISIFKNGATKGSTISFMTSTPQTGIDSIMVTYSMLGLPFAIIRPIIAFITGIIGGIWIDKTEKTIPIKHKQLNSNETKNTKNKFFEIFRYAFIEFMSDIVKWLVVGILLAALIGTIIPNNFLSEYITNPFVGYLLIIIAAIPLYVCATASVPIAAMLLLKGISPGAALLFLMAGPATNAATMTIIGKTLGSRTLIKYLTNIILSGLIFATIIDYVLPSSWFNISSSKFMISHNHTSNTLDMIFAIIFSLLITYHIIIRLFNRSKSLKTTTREIELNKLYTDPILKVSGMTCKHCKANVEQTINSIPGISSVVADNETGIVTISGENINLTKLKLQISQIGYNLEGVIKEK